MDRDYDGRLSFGEFMGEETPLEKVLIVQILGSQKRNIWGTTFSKLEPLFFGNCCKHHLYIGHKR